MNILPSTWICPLCQSLLKPVDRTWQCESRHTFDIAKEGYVNLLLVQNKNSKDPGDNKAMVNARRSFLELQHYQPLAHKLAELYVQYCQGTKDADLHFFDAGCGEGYYMNVVSQYAQSLDIDCVYSGIDISKNAVQKAAKKYAESQFAVASTFNIPVQTASQNAVLQIFAPSSAEEIQRILKSQGIWITVNPAANHLQQLKQALYDAPEKHKQETEVPAGFEVAHQQQLTFDVNLATPKERESLLMMTPYFWTATEDKKQALLNHLESVTADFEIRVLRKV